MTDQHPERPIVVPALEKALDILEYLVFAERHMTVAELSAALDIPQASAFRIVNTLTHRGYLAKRPNGEVHLGPRNALLNRAYVSSNDLRRRAHPYMVELRERTKNAVELAYLDETEIAFIDVLESLMPITVRFTRTVGAPLIGSSNPITLAILSALSEARRRDVLDRMEEVRLSLLHVRPALKKFEFAHDIDHQRLDRIRAQGFAADYGYQTEHVTRIAAPIFNAGGEVLGALGIAGPETYLPESRGAEAAAHVLAVTRELSSEFGHEYSPDPAAVGGGRSDVGL